MGQRGSDQADGVHDVNVETCLPVLLGVRDRESADVRHHDVEAPEGLADLSTHALRASPSPTSTTDPVTLPRLRSSSFVLATSPESRAQKPTTAPSSRKAPTMARPMPRVPPVTRTRLPVS